MRIFHLLYVRYVCAHEDESLSLAAYDNSRAADSLSYTDTDADPDTDTLTRTQDTNTDTDADTDQGTGAHPDTKTQTSALTPTPTHRHRHTTSAPNFTHPTKKDSTSLPTSNAKPPQTITSTPNLGSLAIAATALGFGLSSRTSPRDSRHRCRLHPRIKK